MLSMSIPAPARCCKEIELAEPAVTRLSYVGHGGIPPELVADTTFGCSVTFVRGYGSVGDGREALSQ